MAEYTIRQEVQTIERTVVELPSQTNWVEVEKALAACRHALKDQKSFDNTVQVVADEETIRFMVTHSDTVDHRT